MPLTAGGLPYPDYTDAPDGPSAIEVLALELDDQLAAKSATGHTHVIDDVTDLQTALDAKSPTTHTHTALPNRKARFFNVFAEFDANGVATLSHSLGVEPIGGVFTARTNNATGGTSIATIRFYEGTQTASTLKIRCFGPDGQPFEGSITIHCVIW